jgi:hypothetical protein
LGLAFDIGRRAGRRPFQVALADSLLREKLSTSSSFAADRNVSMSGHWGAHTGANVERDHLACRPSPVLRAYAVSRTRLASSRATTTCAAATDNSSNEAIVAHEACQPDLCVRAVAWDCAAQCSDDN